MDKAPVPPGKWIFKMMNLQLRFALLSRTGMGDDAFFAIVVENLRYTAATPCHRCAKSAIDLISKARYDLVPRSKSGYNKLALRLVNWWNSKAFLRSLRGMGDVIAFLETLPHSLLSHPLLVIFSCVFRVGIDIRFHWSFDSDTARYRWIIEVYDTIDKNQMQLIEAWYFFFLFFPVFFLL